MVFRGQQQIFAGGKPLQILIIEVTQPRVIANYISTGAGVLFLPGPLQTAGRDRRFAQNVLRICTDGLDIRLEMWKRWAGQPSLPGVEGDRLPNTHGRAKSAIGDAAVSANLCQFRT